MADTDSGGTRKVLVWDAPIRVFHWLLVAAFLVCWLTGEDNRFLHLHAGGGYLILGLLVFRMAWGMAGTRYALFSEFMHPWSAVKAHAEAIRSGNPRRFIGHNPLAGWAVLFLMGMGLVVGISGVLVLGLEEGHGPLFALMSPPTAQFFREVHEVSVVLMLCFIPLHVAGVIIEGRMLGENLLHAMISGHKLVGPNDHGVPPMRRVAALLAGLATVATAAYFSGWLTAGGEYRPFVGHALPWNDAYNSECGDCHLAFHPTLLPARSWQRMMDEQADHFGDDLGLDADTVATLLAFMLPNAAESQLDEPAYKINRSVPADSTPLRITETPYWVKKHHEIAAAEWKTDKVHGKADCGACHLDAEEGTFEDSAMRLP
ncbi:MAG: cytochrome b/b6 domain-containing protein [Nitrospirota bacterium]|nr:cytochrome b/b6 domain-containing protein [Nitrospirota bacterium]